MKSTIVITLLGLVGLLSMNSDTGIEGVVYEASSGEKVLFATVSLFQNDSLITSTDTDFDGKYLFNNIRPGGYVIEANYLGLQSIRTESVIVSINQMTTVDIKMKEDAVMMDCVEVVGYKVPLIEMDNTTSGSVLVAEETKSSLKSKVKNIFKKKRHEEIAALPTKNISAIAASTTGVTVSEESCANISIRGSRNDATFYYIDGIRVSPTEAANMIPKAEVRNCKPRIETVDVKDFNDGEEVNPEDVNDEELYQESSKEAGQLTAGEWNDLSNWNDWVDLTDDGVYTEMLDYWELPMGDRISVLVTNEQSIPLANCEVSLLTKRNEVVWQSKTDNNGKVELWQKPKTDKGVKLEVTHENDSYMFTLSDGSKKRDRTIILPVECAFQSVMDIMFVVDATSSMSDEIAYLKAELSDVIRQVSLEAEDEMEINVGAVFYKDKWDDYLTAVSDLSPDLSKTLEFIDEQSIGGGADFPEAMEMGLEKALAQEWNEASINRIIFLVLDAPPHHNKEVLAKLKLQVQEAAAQGIKLIPITASGIDRETEYLMKQMAMMTNGTYVFLTDDSGIGGSHLTHAIPDYDVEKLNELLVRLLIGYAKVSSCEAPLEEVVKVEKKAGEPLSVNLYPNPALEKITVELSDVVDRLVISTSTGRRVMQVDEVNVGKNEIVVGQLRSGMYNMTLVSEGLIIKTIPFMVVS